MRRSFIVLFLMLLVLAVSAPAAAETPEELTLPDLLNAMASSSPDLKKEEAALFKARAGYQEQMAFLYPTVLFSIPVGFSYAPFYNFYYTSSSSALLSQSSAWDISPGFSLTQVLPTSGRIDLSLKDSLTIADPGNSGNPYYAPFIPDLTYSNNISVGLTLQQPIFFEDAFGASLTIVEESFRLASAKYLFAKNELVYQAARTYYGLLKLKNSERLARLSLQDAQLAYEDMKKKLGSGIVTRLAVLKEESRLKKAELDLFDASAALANEYARAAAVYHFKKEYEINPGATTPAIPEPPAAAEAKARVAAKNPELLMARNDLEMKKARVTTTKCENAHTLTLGSNLILDSAYGYETDLGEALADPFDGSANPKLSLTFKLSFKLFDGGAVDAKIRQAALDAEMSALAAAGKSDELAGRIEAAAGKLERSRLNVAYTEAALSVAAQEFEKAGRDFNLGQISRLELDRLELAWRSAELESLQARSERDLASLETLKLMGEDLFSILTGGKQ
jgi:outer membrane protein TolC